VPRRTLPAARPATAIVPGAIALAAAPALAAALVAAPALATAPALASSQHARYYRICRTIGSMIVTGQGGTRYLLRNDNFGQRPECIMNRDRWANFVVTVSGANSRGSGSQAYPELQLGCAWGACTPGSQLPRRVSRLANPVTTWHIATRSAGLWNAGYDIWFSHVEHRAGQDTGAEVMIWLNSTFARPAQHARVLWIGRFRYYFEHWITSSRLTGARWPLIIFRRFQPTDQVNRLPLLPFFRRAERAGLIRSTYWLASIDAGFEIWHGGRGLATAFYSTRL
jgi:cellulose 1,4-beta-cellobiosidase